MCGIIGGNWFISEEQVSKYLDKIIHRGRDNSTIEQVAFNGEISNELLWRPKVFFAKGCRTSDLIENRKDDLKHQLNSIFKYKDKLEVFDYRSIF